MATFSVRGTDTDYAADQAAKAVIDAEVEELQKDHEFGYSLRRSIDVVAPGRAGGQELTEEVADDDVIEYTDANGYVRYSTGAGARERALRVRGDQAIDLVETFATDPQTRGPVDLSRFAIFGLELPVDIKNAQGVLADFVVGKATQLAAREAAKKIVSWVERPRPDGNDNKKRASGVYRVDHDLRLTADRLLKPGETLDEGDAPYLVLIHGTFSNTESAFDGLRGSDDWRQLVERYEGRVAALEHPTLALNPAENALHLAEHLPDHGNLHLVTHSRGGLVGELLSLASHGALEPLRFDRPGGEELEERDVLSRLAASMADRNVRVQKFVRIASPSSGTTLASDKIDRWAGFLLNGLKLIPGAPGAVVGIVKAFLLAFLDQKTDPDVIPGLEAMIPRSPFVRFINSSPKVDDGLAVIAGDVEPGLLNFLAVKGADFFYGADHDFVVDTRSMYQGAPRERGALSFHWGKKVNHFTYFKQEDSRARLHAWLRHRDEDEEYPPGFTEVDPNLPKLAKVKRSRASTERVPTVIVVPDFMGTSLRDDNGIVWPDPVRLAGDGITALSRSAPGIEPGELLEATYQPLSDALDESYRVVLFPYDWRLSLADVSDALAGAVGDELRRDEGAVEPKPVHIVGHGHGGLVARLLRSRSADVWRSLRARGGRVVLLGTPNDGSHRSAQFATGSGDMVQLLRLLDPGRSDAEVARTMRSFAAVMETLPRKGEGLWTTQRWSDAKIKWAPTQKALDGARAVLADLAAESDDGGIMSVVGFNRVTPTGIDTGQDESQAAEVAFSGTVHGDGAVTVSSASAAPGRSFYADVSHGQLPGDPGVLAAVLDLLGDGSTNRLDIEYEPVGGDAGAKELPDVRDRQLYPTARSLEGTALATAAGSLVPSDRIVIRLQIAHGDLKLVDQPVMVGHYEGSTLAGAERALDSALEGALSDRDVLGLYPGKVGEAIYITAGEGEDPKRGIVVGLGEINDMNARKVVAATTAGCLRYAMAELDRRRSGSWAEGQDGLDAGIELATVLLGSYGRAGLSVEGSLASIVKGVVAANERLVERGLADSIRIERVRVLELYDDLAVAAVDAAHKLDIHIGADADTSPVVVEPYLQVLEGREPGQPGLDYGADDWTPIVVESVLRCEDPCPPGCEEVDNGHEHTEGDTDPDGEGDDKPEDGDSAPADKDDIPAESDSRKASHTATRDLVFTSIGRRARAEEAIQSSQQKLLDRIVRQAVNGYSGADLRSNNTLYELLLPNFMKGEAREAANMLWVLDSEATRYPWEMLATRVGERLEPLATEIGMLRRLTTSAFRQGVAYAATNRALVIGDPYTQFARLPGARDEAQQVAGRLRINGYEVTSVISEADDKSDRSTEILNALFEHDYRIVHIAAHGDYNAADPAKSGAVIGPDMFLTALELKQLQAIPPLVFLNCCHLAKVDKPRQSRLLGLFHRFAASVSEQLIRDGVRAVVAAGWAVDDAAALDFAGSFYDRMLEGRPFGESVRLARKSTYDAHRDVNTWGAYQCYGDPGYRLTTKRPRRTGTDTIRAESRLLSDVKWLAHQAAKADEAGKVEVLKRLETVFKSTPTRWHKGEVLYQAGRAYGELGVFSQAIDYSTRALEDWGASAPIKVLEQLANVEARHAVELATSVKPDWSEVARLLREAKERLDLLLKIGETSERIALVGSYHRRRAMITRYRKSSLGQAADAYKQASDLYASKHNGAIDPYAATNAAALRALQGEVPEDEALALDDLLARAIEEAKRRVTSDPQFWNRVAVPDAEVARGLIMGDMSERTEAVIDGYYDAFRMRSSARQRESVFDHLAFLSMILRSSQGEVIENSADLADAIDQVESELSRRTKAKV